MQAASDAPAQPVYTSLYRNYTLAILFLGYVVNFVDRSILSILLEPIKLELQLTDTQLGLLGGLAFALFYATLGIPIASLADRWSRVKVLSISMIIWSAMTALCGMASSFIFHSRSGPPRSRSTPWGFPSARWSAISSVAGVPRNSAGA